MYPKLEFGGLGGYFRLKTETVRIKVDILYYAGQEKLVTGFHICEIKAAAQIAVYGQYPVNQVMERSEYLCV